MFQGFKKATPYGCARKLRLSRPSVRFEGGKGVKIPKIFPRGLGIAPYKEYIFKHINLLFIKTPYVVIRFRGLS